MPDKPTDLRREIALFRYSVIAEILCLPPGSAQRWALIRDQAGRAHAIPGSRRTRVAITTIRNWLALYEDGGFDALHPKRRQDRGQPRGLPPAVAELLVRLKETRLINVSTRRVIWSEPIKVSFTTSRSRPEPALPECERSRPERGR